MLILMWGKTELGEKSLNWINIIIFVVIKVIIISVYVTIMSLMHKNHITKIS